MNCASRRVLQSIITAHSCKWFRRVRELWIGIMRSSCRFSRRKSRRHLDNNQSGIEILKINLFVHWISSDSLKKTQNLYIEVFVNGNIILSDWFPLSLLLYSKLNNGLKGRMINRAKGYWTHKGMLIWALCYLLPRTSVIDTISRRAWCPFQAFDAAAPLDSAGGYEVLFVKSKALSRFRGDRWNQGPCALTAYTTLYLVMYLRLLLHSYISLWRYEVWSAPNIWLTITTISTARLNDISHGENPHFSLSWWYSTKPELPQNSQNESEVDFLALALMIACFRSDCTWIITTNDSLVLFEQTIF